MKVGIPVNMVEQSTFASTPLLRQEIADWCQANLKGLFRVTFINFGERPDVRYKFYVVFDEESDGIHFKMRWF